MAVLVEGISVIVKRERIDDAYPGGWSGFVSDCPNRTLCADRNLARVGFMDQSIADGFVLDLLGRGLAFEDFALVDQVVGAMGDTGWLEVGTVVLDGRNRVGVARLKGDDEKQLALPDGWSYERSLTSKFGYQRLVVGSDGLPREVTASHGLEADAQAEARRGLFSSLLRRLRRAGS